MERSYHGRDSSMEMLGCCGCRRKTRCTVFICQILVIMWLLAVYLRYVTNDTGRRDRDVTPAFKPKNVFEGFNRHSVVFRGMEINDYNYVDESINSTRKTPKKQSKLLSKKFRFESNPLLPPANCLGVVQGENDAIEDTALLQLELRSKKNEGIRKQIDHMDDFIMKMTDNCTDFISRRKYISSPLTPEEEAYPIAYIITIHNKFSIFERLLRSIYHPQNIYCVHVDKKSPLEFLQGVKKLSQCFPNVFVPSKLSEVHYTHWSRVEADINCFEDLVKRSEETPWKYVLNLCGQDFPLKTNLDIVRILKSFHGYNNMETFTVPDHKKKRYEFHFDLPKASDSDHKLMEKTDIRKAPSPLNSPMFAGSAYYAWKREAVEFMITDSNVAKFFEWNKDSYSPDEHMWATLQRWYPYVPGSFPPHEKYDLNELQSVTRLVKWAGLDTSVYPKCSGRFRRGVCVYGVGDLPWLLQQHHLFANKFDFDVDPYAIECLDTWLRNRTLLQSYIYHSKGFV